jgi:hypothetical protein
MRLDPARDDTEDHRQRDDAGELDHLASLQKAMR